MERYKGASADPTIFQAKSNDASSFPSVRTSSNRMARFFITSLSSAMFIGRAFQISRTSDNGTGRNWATAFQVNRTSKHFVARIGGLDPHLGVQREVLDIAAPAMNLLSICASAD